MKKNVISVLIVVSLLTVLVFLPNTVQADWFAGIAIGGAFNENADTTISGSGISVSGKTDLKDSFTFGFRVGYWLEQYEWFGLAIDGSYFQADPSINISNVEEDINVIPVSGLLVFRLPLARNEKFPTGQFQPYAAIGPSIFISNFEHKEPGFEVDDSSLDIGLDIRAGITYMFHPAAGIFGEYRYTYFEANYSGGSQVKIDADIGTNHMLFGLVVNF